MLDALETEELALRRRLLFRLLRSQRPGRPEFHREAIAELVPKGLIAPGDSLFKAPPEAPRKPV